MKSVFSVSLLLLLCIGLFIVAIEIKPAHDRTALSAALQTHDVAITSIATLKAGGNPATVGRYQTLNVSITVLNNGTFSENSINLTVCATREETILNWSKSVGTAILSLDAGASTTVNFVWNVTGYCTKSHMIDATVQPILGETNTGDNIMSGGPIMITVPGDLNGDSQVNITDLVILANAYRSSQGETKWNPNADINNNGVVGLSDLVLLASNYGKIAPELEAQIRDEAMQFIVANHTETEQYIKNLTWTGGYSTPPGYVGYVTYSYIGTQWNVTDDWNVTLGYVVYPNVNIAINVTYTASAGLDIKHVEFQWNGYWSHGQDYEVSYQYNPYIPT